MWLFNMSAVFYNFTVSITSSHLSCQALPCLASPCLSLPHLALLHKLFPLSFCLPSLTTMHSTYGSIKRLNKPWSHSHETCNNLKIGLFFILKFSSGYLKIYQLNRPVLDGYDCLLVDEAQDCTPGENV